MAQQGRTSSTSEDDDHVVRHYTMNPTTLSSPDSKIAPRGTLTAYAIVMILFFIIAIVRLSGSV